MSTVTEKGQATIPKNIRDILGILPGDEVEFDIEEKTFNVISQNAKLIEEIAWERIRDEMLKILASKKPDAGVMKLKEARILQIILPELIKCFGIVQTGPKHARVYDIGEHSLLTLKYISSKDPLVRLVALLHDVGKVDTQQTHPDGNVTFYNHDVAGGKIVLKIAKRFNLSQQPSL